MDSDLNEALISTDVENTETHTKSPKFHMDTSHSTSALSSLFRTIPLFIKHTAPSSTTRVVHLDGNESDYESDSNQKTEDDHKESSKPIVFDDEKERKRLADIMKAGLNHLLCDIQDKQAFLGLGLKVILDVDHEQIQEDFEDSAEKTSFDEPLFKMEAEDAVGLLLDYGGFWQHSCSVVLTDLQTTSNRKRSSNLRGRKKEENNQLSSGYAEVVLLVLVEGHIDDKRISDGEQLKNFLIELSENKMLGVWKKVHATCSSVTV